MAALHRERTRDLSGRASRRSNSRRRLSSSGPGRPSGRPVSASAQIPAPITMITKLPAGTALTPGADANYDFAWTGADAQSIVTVQIIVNGTYQYVSAAPASAGSTSIFGILPGLCSPGFNFFCAGPIPAGDAVEVDHHPSASQLALAAVHRSGTRPGRLVDVDLRLRLQRPDRLDRLISRPLACANKSPPSPISIASARPHSDRSCARSGSSRTRRSRAASARVPCATDRTR